MKFQKHFGLDIGSSTMKAIQLDEVANGRFRLVASGSVPTPELEDPTGKFSALVEAVKKLVSGSKISTKAVAVSLPESQIYTRVIEMPFLEEPELTGAIKWQAEQYLPVPISEVVLKHQVLSLPETGTPNAKMEVLLVAAPNTVVNQYMTILERAGLEVLAIETEVFAAARAIIAQDAYAPTTLLINLGADITTMAVIERGDLALTQSLPTGGLALSRAIASSLGLEMVQAEEYKKSYGLDSTKLDGKVVAAMKPIVTLIVSEAKKSQAYFETHHVGKQIKRVVLTGGTALLPGIVQYFTEGLSLETQLADPFISVNLTDREKMGFGDTAVLFATAIGLAMKMT